jgi:hypothetical protein
MSAFRSFSHPDASSFLPPSAQYKRALPQSRLWVGGLSLRPLRISAFSAFNGNFNAEVAEIRRGRREKRTSFTFCAKLCKRTLKAFYKNFRARSDRLFALEVWKAVCGSNGHEAVRQMRAVVYRRSS